MTNRMAVLVVFSVLQVVSACGFAAENDGQEDLDKATRLKISAKTLAQLSEVATLCETAIESGLDPDNEQFARKLLAASLYQRAADLCRPIFDRKDGPDPRWQILRKVSLADLEKIVEYDDKFGEAYLLIAKLQVLPAGDRDAAKAAVSRASELLQDDKKMQSELAILQSKLEEGPDKRLAALDRAVELDPENVRAWQERAEFYRQQGDFTKAIEDFSRLLEKDGQNPRIRLAVAEALANLDKYDESLAEIDKVIQSQPTVIAHTLRARIWIMQGKMDKAIVDLDQALKLEEDQQRTLSLLLMRAQLYYSQSRYALAVDDLDRVLKAMPGLTEAILLRSLVYASQDRLAESIRDIESLLEKEPDNVGWKLQLATFVNANSQPRKAIGLFDTVLKQDATNGLARSGRANAFLSIGEHRKAVSDYMIALKSMTEDSSMLNNLAWVLATSPDEALRDGKRAVEYATKACEVTEYKQAHILSTLAAAFAEEGDFKSAVEWSQKAVDLFESTEESKDESTDEQLKKELESYQQQKPWRERQQIEDQP